MKTWTTLFCCVCVAGFVSAQNLVPNPGFESYYQCPSSFSYFGVKNFAPGWYSPSLGTPDMFNRCSFVDAGVPRNWAGVTNALEGNGYCGIYMWINKINYREYLQAKLNERLITGRTYRVELYFKLSSYSKFAIDRIGVLLSDSAIFFNHDQIIDVKPTFTHVMDSAYNQGTRLWNRVHFDYVAKGGEGFITIGNFSSGEETKSVYLDFSPVNEKLLSKAAYFFIDEVSLVEIDSTVHATALKDTLSIDENDVRTNEVYTLKHIRFSFDSYQLLPTSYPELNRLILVLKKNPKWRVELSGHTDDQGSAEYNLRLSQTRALTVSEYLVQNGVSSERIRIRGFGKSKPIQEGSDEEARALNRRVEAKFLD
ncbi:MAG TPA: hypothetical protein DGG95_14025 [Cytophagales bacterium]|jgi:OmpA-OmpF porin, OOP family|nr:hypothetical protein [Cytophagales bacterium]